MSSTTSSSSQPPSEPLDSTSSHPRSTGHAHHPDASKERFPPTHAPATPELASLKIRIQQSLRQYPDFPSPGILFEDILPLFRDPALHESLVRALELHITTHYPKKQGKNPDIIVGLEARGFLFGPSLALRLGAGFVPVRKQGKLPGRTETAAYEKEYGQDFFQIQADAIKPGQKVLVIDDIIATGGSAAATGSLVKKLGGTLLGYVFILELDFLKGREKLDASVYTLLSSQEGPPKES